MGEQGSLFDDVRPPALKGDPRFEQFWALYPATRRMNKTKTAEVFARRVETVRDWMTILRVLPLQIASAQWTEHPRFIPHATTYLNGRRWEDDPRVYAAAPPTAAELEVAHRIRKNARGGCPHDPVCARWLDCIEQIVADNRGRR
jgi:hypothetical protein